jgi:hypothetical protein
VNAFFSFLFLPCFAEEGQLAELLSLDRVLSGLVSGLSYWGKVVAGGNCVDRKLRQSTAFPSATSPASTHATPFVSSEKLGVPVLGKEVAG